MAKVLYHTILTSRRHKDSGYCEDSDFGKIELIQASNEEAPIYCTIIDYQLNQELRLFGNDFYGDYDRWNHKKYFDGRQGKFSEKSAIAEMVKIRSESEADTSWTSARTMKYLLVGRKLYVHYCKRRQLVINQTGNTLFGDWWTLDVETPNPNLKSVPFNRKNFERELAKTKRWLTEKGCFKREKFHFSYPKIKWPPKPIAKSVQEVQAA